MQWCKRSSEHDVPAPWAPCRSEARPVGYDPVVDSDTGAEPEVSASAAGGVATVGVVGELTESARRPLVRVLTDLLLSGVPLHRLDLDLRGVGFMNSAGMAVLVQLLRMADPRGVEVVLVAPSTAVVRPLQLSGLWHRFPMREDGEPAG
jgi:anti-anti-sigma factor